MEPFNRLKAVAAPLLLDNIDTDMILPAAFLKTISRTGLGRALFHSARFDDEGRQRPNFILNREPWQHSQVLIASENFGCGSSREHAVWALLDFGIRCVIARSFADIFYSNCFKNGILPIILPAAQIELLCTDAAQPETCRLDIDLEALTVMRSAGAVLSFCIESQQRERLLRGLDDIAVSLGHAGAIARYEKNSRLRRPWMSPIPIELCSAGRPGRAGPGRVLGDRRGDGRRC